INTLCGLLVSQFCVDFRVLLYCSGQHQRKSDNGSFFRFPFSIIKTKNEKGGILDFSFQNENPLAAKYTDQSEALTRFLLPGTSLQLNKLTTLPLQFVFRMREFYEEDAITVAQLEAGWVGLCPCNIQHRNVYDETVTSAHNCLQQHNIIRRSSLIILLSKCTRLMH